jgi:predicted transcriptional regulator
MSLVKTETVPIQFFAQPELREELRGVARRNERSLSSEARFAIRQHLEREQDSERAVNTSTVTRVA